MRPTRPSTRGAILVLAGLIAIGGCQQPAALPPADSTAPGTAAPSAEPDGSPAIDANGLPVVQLADAEDPAAGATHERDLVRQLRDDAGMPAFIGPNGAAALSALDAATSERAATILQAVAEAVDAGTLPTGASVDPLAGLLASTTGLPRPTRALPAIDISLFADTGFTTSALVSVLTSVVAQAAESNSGSVTRPDSVTQESDGLRQQVDLSTTITIQTGGGRVTADLMLTATDRISSTAGTFVGLYTSTSTAHFDVSACPDRNGRAERHEQPAVRSRPLGQLPVRPRQRRRCQARARRSQSRSRGRCARTRHARRSRADRPVRLVGRAAGPDRHARVGLLGVERWRPPGHRHRR